MLAKLLDAFTIPAGRLTEVEVGRALASTKLRSKHHRRQEINSRPRERDNFGFCVENGGGKSKCDYDETSQEVLALVQANDDGSLD
ncbi:unnamed protein product [Rangifer tarandus platyrhynchus]|uniref:Uncharacterized protein n=1 Tax=Rangifer tarandus platyrhynchus TaxID=3082113 RepID=A0AC59YG11_RANTA